MGAGDFDPATQNGPISNEIIPLPDRSPVEGFYLFTTNHNNQAALGNSIVVIRSTDKGQTWSKRRSSSSGLI